MLTGLKCFMLHVNNRKIIFVFMLLSVINSFAQTTISSVAELATAASNSDQDIVMTPGVYQMQDYLTSTVIRNTVPDGNNRHAMIEFSGNNNTFDLTGVTIEVNSALLNDYGTRIIEFYITGNQVKIKGVTITDIGNSAPSSPGMQSVTVAGENNTIEDVTLNVNGSHPYGYGDLLGKGGTNLLTLRKHSGLLVEGLNINIIRCSIYSQSFGHLFFIQGGRNVLFEDCYAEAVTRTTDAMLSETSGPAFDRDFEAVYPNYDGDKIITPGYTKSLSEVGYRSYGSGGVDGNTTGAITLINCVAKDTRSGFAFTRYGGDVLMQNCQATGCEAGYQVEEVTIENSRGDAVNGPLLYLNGGASNVELELIPNTTTTTLHAIAAIAGDNHRVTLTNLNDVVRPQTHPILLGVSRPTAANPFSPLGTDSTSGTILNNCTGMPIEIVSSVSSCIINTNGEVTDNGGSGNIIDKTRCIGIEPEPIKGGLVDESYTIRSTSTEADLFYGWDPDFSSTYGFMTVDEEKQQLICTFEDNGSGYVRFYWRKKDPSLYKLNQTNYPIIAMKGKRPDSYSNFTFNLNNTNGSVVQFKDGASVDGEETLAFSKLLPGTTDVYYWNLEDLIPSTETWELSGFNCVNTEELNPVSVMKIDYIKTFENLESLTTFNASLSSRDLEHELGFNIYPNPIENILFIDNNQLKNTVITILDVNGRILMENNFKAQNNKINISNLESGVYFMRAVTGSNSFVKKIIKK